MNKTSLVMAVLILTSVQLCARAANEDTIAQIGEYLQGHPGVVLERRHQIGTLCKTVLSAGSPLAPDMAEHAAAHFKVFLDDALLGGAGAPGSAKAEAVDLSIEWAVRNYMEMDPLTAEERKLAERRLTGLKSVVERLTGRLIPSAPPEVRKAIARRIEMRLSAELEGKVGNYFYPTMLYPIRELNEDQLVQLVLEDPVLAGVDERYRSDLSTVLKGERAGMSKARAVDSFADFTALRVWSAMIDPMRQSFDQRRARKTIKPMPEALLHAQRKAHAGLRQEIEDAERKRQMLRSPATTQAVNGSESWLKGSGVIVDDGEVIAAGVGLYPGRTDATTLATTVPTTVP